MKIRHRRQLNIQSARGLVNRLLARKSVMKQQFTLFKWESFYFSEDTSTGEQRSLRTKIKDEAIVLLNAKNEPPGWIEGFGCPQLPH
jgi:hypothetical protein